MAKRGRPKMKKPKKQTQPEDVEWTVASHCDLLMTLKRVHISPDRKPKVYMAPGGEVKNDDNRKSNNLYNSNQHSSHVTPEIHDNISPDEKRLSLIKQLVQNKKPTPKFERSGIKEKRLVNISYS